MHPVTRQTVQRQPTAARPQRRLADGRLLLRGPRSRSVCGLSQVHQASGQCAVGARMVREHGERNGARGAAGTAGAGDAHAELVALAGQPEVEGAARRVRGAATD